MEIIGESFNLPIDNNQALIDDSSSIYRRWLHGKVHVEAFETHRQELYITVFHHLSQLFNVKPGSQSTISVHGNLCHNVLNMMSQFAYNQSDKVDLSTWKQIFPTILGIGDYLFHSSSARQLLTELGPHYLQTLFNMYICSQVTDDGCWALFQSIATRWTQQKILIEQWFSTLQTLAHYINYSLYGYPFGNKSVQLIITHGKPAVPLSDITYKQALFLFSKFFHIVGNPNYFTSSASFIQLLQSLTSIITLLAHPDSTITSRELWSQIKTVPPPININSILSFCGSWLVQAIVEEKDFSHTGLLRFRADPTSGSIFEDHSRSGMYVSGTSVAASAYFTLITSYCSLPLSPNNLSQFYATLSIAISPVSPLQLRSATLHAVVPLFCNDIRGTKPLAAFLWPFLNNLTLNETGEQFVIMRRDAITLLSTLYAFGHQYGDKPIPHLANTDKPYVFFLNHISEPARPDVTLVPTDLRDSSSHTLTLTPFFQVWERDDNQREEKQEQESEGEVLSEEKAREQQELQKWREMRKLYSIDLRPKSFSELSGLIHTHFLTLLTVERNVPNLHRLIHSLGMIFHEEIQLVLSAFLPTSTHFRPLIQNEREMLPYLFSTKNSQHSTDLSASPSLQHSLSICQSIINAFVHRLCVPFTLQESEHFPFGLPSAPFTSPHSSVLMDFLQSLQSFAPFFSILNYFEPELILSILTRIGSFTELLLLCTVSDLHTFVRPSTPASTPSVDELVLGECFSTLTEIVMYSGDSLNSKEGAELIGQLLSLVQFSISCQPSIPPRQPVNEQTQNQIWPASSQLYAAKTLATCLLVRFQQYPLPHDSAVSSYLSSADVAKKEAQRITDQLSHFILEKGEKETAESAEKKPVQLAPNPPLSRELEKEEEEQEQNEDTSEPEDNSESNQLEGDEEKAAEEEGKENQPPKELEKDTHPPTESEKEKEHTKQDRVVPATSSTQTPAAAPTTTTATSFKNPYRSHRPPKVTAERVMKQYIQNNSTVISTVESIASIREDHPVGNSLFLFVNDPSGQYAWKGTCHNFAESTVLANSRGSRAVPEGGSGEREERRGNPFFVKGSEEESQTRQDDVLQVLLNQKSLVEQNESLATAREVSMQAKLQKRREKRKTMSTVQNKDDENVKDTTIQQPHPYLSQISSLNQNLTKHVFIPPPPHTFTPPIPPHTSATPSRKGFFPQTYSYNTSNRLFWSHFGGTSTDKRTCGVLFAPPGEDESMSKFLMRPNTLAFNRNLETNTFSLNHNCDDKQPRLNPLPQSSQLARDFSRLNESPERSQHKIGVIYVRNGQVEQNAILTNETSSPFFVSFIKSLGWEVDLATHKGFMGGLDRTGIAGVTSPYYSDYANEVIFHVPSFWMSRPDDPQQIHKKRHVGNDHVHIIWNEHTQEYKPNTISSQFNFAHIVVNAIPSSGNRLFRVRVFAKKLQHSVGDKLSGPLVDNAVVSIRALPELLRQTVMNANRSARIMQNLFLRPYAQREESIDNLLKHTANTGGLTSELQQFIPSSHSVM
ncbi:putative Ral GTPase-activating protein subunit alpha-2 [Blattamonas nauphoetae]|uniref:Ral GTPase-activating protein subunit alpha-2 n=1 Tax=Blattamonas nauphoetae TaxID=2049346 RepID=A0ABQ9WYE2_9EUKA|nr:putative Ral GTPase-activating protein subunit alpha-2 [Blattamonas nauphoetae]